MADHETSESAKILYWSAALTFRRFDRGGCWPESLSRTFLGIATCLVVE